MRTVNGRRRERGVSLVEAMMALGIFTLGLTGVMKMQTISSRQNSEGARAMRAAAVARTVLTIVHRYPYGDLVACRQHSAEMTEAEMKDALAYDNQKVDDSKMDVDLRPGTSLPAGCKVNLKEINESMVHDDLFSKHLVFEPYKDNTGTQVGLKVAAIVGWSERNGTGQATMRTVVMHDVIFDTAKNFATIHDF